MAESKADCEIDIVFKNKEQLKLGERIGYT